jgi:hypothetical protein
MSTMQKIAEIEAEVRAAPPTACHCRTPWLCGAISRCFVARRARCACESTAHSGRRGRAAPQPHRSRPHAPPPGADGQDAEEQGTQWPTVQRLPFGSDAAARTHAQATMGHLGRLKARLAKLKGASRSAALRCVPVLTRAPARSRGAHAQVGRRRQAWRGLRRDQSRRCARRSYRCGPRLRGSAQCLVPLCS